MATSARSWLLALTLCLAACSSDGEESTNLFGPGVEQVILEVDYEAGAAPFDAYPRRDGSPWELLEDNLEALFAQSTPRTLIVPKTLSEMQGLGALVADAIQFARERFMGEDTVVFGPECLDDAYVAADAE